jgi:iron complex outermembrane receptor protein
MAREKAASLARGSALALGLVAWWLPVAVAAAETPRKHFDIEQGDLTLSLKTFSQQADAPVMTFADIRGKTARRVSGLLPPEAALAALISGQGLKAQHVAGGFVLKPIKASAPSRPRETPTTVPNGPPTEVEAVVVNGFRDALLQARTLKRDATGSQDVIVAEDIAAFPDLNLAESLQRIPGVAISRDAGEGRQIALRGLGPDFTRAQLNGMEVSASTSSGFDNRGSVSRTRAFDYSIFASELFNRVSVRKSYAVDQDEGGIGGTVELRTAKPFDYPGFKLVLSAKGLNNGNTGGVTPRVAGLISDHWGDLGVLVSAAYSENDINEYGYRDWGWTPINVGAANIGPGVSAADADRLINATGADRVVAPQAQTYSTWLDRRKRLGITATLQYQPVGPLTAGLDLMFGRLSNDRNEYSLAAAGNNALTGDIVGTQRLNAAAIRGDTLIYGDFTGVDMRTEHKHSVDSTLFLQGALNAVYEFSDRLKFTGMVGYSKSDFEEPVFDKVFLQATNKAFSFDFRGPGREGINTYGFDIADPAQWSLMRADTREDAIVNAFTTGRADLTYRAGGGSSLKLGSLYKVFRNDGYQRRGRVDYGDGAPAAVKTLFDGASIAPYVVGDVEATFPLLGQNRDLTVADDTPGADYSLTEKTFASYLQYQFDGMAWDWPVRADFGLRYYRTALTSAGMVSTGTTLEPAVISHRYDGVLPALNLAVDLSPRLVARFSANRNISRPSLSDLRAAGNVDSNPFGGTISAGNPNLRPFLADSVEGSLEFYQGRTGYLAVSLFYKSMDSFITTETTAVAYGSTGYPLQFLSPGQDASAIYNFNRPVNGPGASIKGVEVAFQRDFDFLPAPFDRFGFVGNVTYAQGRSDVIIDGVAVSLALPQLSRWSSNATFYYETARWGARLSSAYRNGYVDGAGGDGNVGSGYHGGNNIDFAAHYNLGDRLKIVAEGINLTDQAIDQYVDLAADRVAAYTRSGRTFTLGVAYEF